MKKIIALYCMMFSAFAYCVAVDGVNVFPVHPSKMDEFNAKTGGLVFPPKDAKHLLLLDARKDMTPALDNYVKGAELVARVACEQRKATCDESTNPWKLAKEAKKGNVGAVILFYEREDCPILTIYPEEAIALLNIRPLYDADIKVRNYRFNKEYWRAIGFALGGYANSMQPGSVLQPVYSIAELDALSGTSLSPQQIASISASKSKTKVYGRGAIPYSRAVREGWAPSPTNAIQRALYERFSNPSARFRKDLKPKVQYK